MLQGFWSYVHRDDEADGGRIVRLANDLVAQYEMFTGETISLLFDKDLLKWGDNWRDKIDDSLASVAFFIPVMTPRYFMSSECRRELQFFARRADRLGIKELVLPLLYVDVPALDDSIQDDLITLMRTFQREDWRQRRYLDVASEGYRRGVADLARRLVAANKHAEEANVAETALSLGSIPEDEEDTSPGLLDRVAGAEEALPQWNETLVAIGREIENIGRVMQEATAEMSPGGGTGRQGFAQRLAVARRVARQLSEPVDRISTSGNAFATQLQEVDEGLRAIIEQATTEIGENPETKSQFCQFAAMVRDLSQKAHDGLTSVQQMIDAIAPIEKASRDLRPVLRRLRQGLTVMVGGREVTDGWVRLLDNCGVDCTDSTSNNEQP